MNRPKAHRWEWAWLIMALVVYIVRSCTVTPAPASDKARRVTPDVWAGSPATNPPLLNDYNWKIVYSGDAVKTSSIGQAELQLVDCSGSIYVFKNSAIEVHACLKTESGGGAAFCSEDGTAWFNQVCVNHYIVDTAAGRVTIAGTTFSVTYVPERQLMLVIVYEGQVEVQPVVNFDTGELATQTIPLIGGQAVYVQNPRLPQIPGAPQPNVPFPIDQLPPLFDTLGLRPWADDIAVRARLDGVQLPDNWLGNPLNIALLSDGGVLHDPTVQQAVLEAIDKDALLAATFPGRNVALVGSVGGAEIDARTIKYDPTDAASLLAKANLGGGFGVDLLYPAGDQQLSGMAERMIMYLKAIGVTTAMAPVPMIDMQAQVNARISAGAAVLWLERR